MAPGRIARITFLGLLLGVVAGEAVAQRTGCQPGEMLEDDEALQERIRVRAEEVYYEFHHRDPRTVAPSEQVSAPSRSGTSTSLVEGADFPSIFALALDQELFEAEALTLNLSPFAFVTAFDPGVVDDQRRYELPLYRWLRRWGATVSFGGEGEAFDRDGDGEPDEALKAEEPGDIVTWEVRYRWGSRDRRDRSNSRRFFAEMDAALLQNHEAWSDLLDALPDDIARMSDSGGRIPCDAFDRILAASDLETKLLAVAESDEAIVEAADAAWKQIDARPLVTLVAGGVERDPEFGANQRFFALRGSWRRHTLNLEFSTEDGLMGADDPETWKLSYELSALWWKGRWPGGEDGVEASIAASYETFDHVPDAVHDTNAKFGAKLEFPVRDGVALPVSVTWVNHEDLLGDEDEIVGHFGISFDAGSLFGNGGGS